MAARQGPTARPGAKDWTPQPEGGVRAGTRVADRFVVLEHLGTGGGAVVVRARDEQLRALVAVKLLRSRDAELRRRFAREAEMLANLNHASIVRVLAHGADGEDLFMALELVDGPNLGERLRTSGALPWRQVVEIGIQIADALETIHRVGLIHRDVKPANIMLAADAPAVQVKLIDLGWARMTESYRDPAGFTPEPRRPTEVGLAIGTPGYLPLEAGLVPADERFDVFGLGATLYELLTGQLPGIEPLRPLHEVNPACDAPPDLGLVLAAALALEPSDRTQSAAELGAALAAIRTAHPEHTASRWLDGRYELLSVIGTGAKGEAFLANHRGSGHDVALKFLRSKDPDERRRFEREAGLLAALDAPGLPRFFDYAPLAERPYIAMARAPGLPAARFCLSSDKIRLRPAEVVEVGLQISRTLKYLHERGVLHRDLNANNVIIELGRTPKATLIDLGCAALLPEYYTHVSRRYVTPPEARVVIPDGGIENLPWSAPEVKAGEGWTGRSDVYSLGLLLYRLLTGKLPTVPGDDEPTPVRRYAPACPDDVADVVLEALQPRPDDRPTAAQLEVAFAEIVEEAELIRVADQAAATRIDSADAASKPAVIDEKVPPSLPAPGRPSGATQRRSWPRPVLLGMVGAVALATAWWAGKAGSMPAAAGECSNVAVNTAPPRAAHAVDSPPPVIETSNTTAPALRTMRATLDSVESEMRRCAVLEGGLLVVEFTTAGGSFGTVAPRTSEDTVVDCVRTATAALSFQPAEAQVFTEEYEP